MRSLLILMALAAVSPARADYKLELGGFLGAHFFSDSNGLGRYAGDPADNILSHSANFGMRLGIVVHPRIVLEAELALMPTTTHSGVQVLAFGWRAHVVVNLLTGRVKPFILAGGGGFTSSSSNPDVLASDTDGELHGGIGVKWDVRRNWGVRLDGRVQFSPAIAGIYFTEDYEVTLGAYGTFSSAKEGPIASSLPPTPPRPPLPPIEKDTDGDGIVDRLDQCPLEKGLPENHGCPDKDTDGDGIIDRFDRCPNEKGISENEGCPDRDSDSDGIVDRLDACPDAAETKNGFKDTDGCPDELPDDLKKITGVVAIEFPAGKSSFMASSYPVLDQIAAALKVYPDVKIEISVHTDDLGLRDKNMALSSSRAEAIIAQLVGKGIDRARLVGIAVGPDKPLTTEKSADAKAKNRRVEIRLIP